MFNPLKLNHLVLIWRNALRFVALRQLLIINNFRENMTHPTEQNNLLRDIRQLIAHAQQRAAAAVNAELTLLYWQIGKRIQHEVLQGQRAEYGQQVMSTLAEQLVREYGKGWSKRQLWLCVQMATVFPDADMVRTVCAELSWSHLRLLLGFDDPLKRDFYIEICRLERWSVRQLQNRIQSMLCAPLPRFRCAASRLRMECTSFPSPRRLG